MPLIVKNIAQIRAKMEKDAEEILNEVSQLALKALRKSIIDNVYKYDYFPNVSYFDDTGRPTFEFLRAWEMDNPHWSTLTENIKSISKKIFYTPKDMQFDPKKWLHGSFAGDARDTLMDILNTATKGDGERTSNLKIGNSYLSKRRKPYWDIFIEDMLSGGQLAKWFADAAIKRGYQILPPS